MAKVYVARPIPEVGVDLLKGKFDVEVNPENKVLSKDELKEAVRGVDAILSLLTDKINGEVLDAAGSQLKVVANYAVGYDNIDVEAAKQKNVMVTNTPGVLTEAVTEHAIGLMFAAAKSVVGADKYTRGGEYKQWEPKGFLGPQITGKTLGVVGLGRIGSMVAQVAHAGLKMNILYFDVKRNEEFESRVEAKYKELDDILKEADFISIHVPLLPATKHLINSEKLKLMKKSAVLINTSRGPVVDERALVEALKNKEIWAAGLDVYENEPELSPGLADLPNVVLTPHTASATFEARDAMSKIAAENIIAVLEGQTPPNLVK